MAVFVATGKKFGQATLDGPDNDESHQVEGSPGEGFLPLPRIPRQGTGMETDASARRRGGGDIVAVTASSTAPDLTTGHTTPASSSSTPGPAKTTTVSERLIPVAAVSDRTANPRLVKAEHIAYAAR
jgi:hypothetical protein